jgi:hypothetical protein
MRGEVKTFMKMPTSPLTASRKKPVRPARPKPKRKSKTDRLEILDALHERCERVEMVAGLLEACDDPHSLSPELAARAGYFIEEELGRVRELLAKFEGGMR